MISTELEYAFGNHRAFYDCLQTVVRVLRKRYRPTCPQLPKSFAFIESKSGQHLGKYRLTGPLFDFYNGRRHVFLTLRKIRDSILHHGYSPSELYVLRDGFAVKIDGGLGQKLQDLNLWPEGLLKPNRLGSLLAVFEFLVRDMFDAMNQLGTTLLRCFKDPPLAIASGYQLFLRSSVSKHLASLDTYRQQHWLDPRVVLGIARADSAVNGGGLHASNGA